MAKVLPPPKGSTVEIVALGNVPGRRVTWGAPDLTRAAIHLHGGAYVFGSSKSHQGLGGQVAMRLGCPVYVLDYRLAPEYPWPAAEDDAFAAFQALVASGIAPSDVVVTGDSAGGGLAVGLALRAIEAGLEPPGMLAMLCPWVDLSPNYPVENNDPALTPEFLAVAAARYLAGTTPDHPARELLLADLTGLPLILMQISDDDPSTPDSVRFAERARSFGVEVVDQTFTGVWHGFQAYAGILQSADDALDSVAAHARRVWAEAGAARR
ncbi:alpha/beta hydrolase fold domain-containing protein [Mycobacterium sp. GA-2829]|uniref:alpha/beta hydrolase fold domain-containing protein n=1 Tax=Mycobacterium sp. GA-2829 TaxID=1772283 RepID=UPI00073FAA40|nr:alpha/beta hydrolase fold domain-containing protein [Mycobacterium sp. GA-2829]KUI29213.1 hypothetical protein AU194_20245 [Mycobacterium sp. GA-2829]